MIRALPVVFASTGLALPARLPGDSYKLTIRFWPVTQLPFVFEALKTGDRPGRM